MASADQNFSDLNACVCLTEYQAVPLNMILGLSRSDSWKQQKIEFCLHFSQVHYARKTRRLPASFGGGDF